MLINELTTEAVSFVVLLAAAMFCCTLLVETGASTVTAVPTGVPAAMPVICTLAVPVDRAVSGTAPDTAEMFRLPVRRAVNWLLSTFTGAP